MAKIAISLLFLLLGFMLKAQINPLANQGFDLASQEEKYLSNADFTAFKGTSFDSLDGESYLLQKTSSDYKIFFSPAAELTAISSQLNDSPLFGIGFYSRMQFKEKLKFGMDAIYYTGTLAEYQRQFLSQNQVYPGAGVVDGQMNKIIDFNYHNIYLEYNANQYFTFSLGKGRQFIGDGYRSLLRSDYQNATPFFKIKTKFWNIEYTNLFELHQNIHNVELNRDNFQQKFIASHFLDWKANRWLSIGLFETVIWQNDDGQFKRGFDLNYLNPFIFYRPIEFSTGSSDNVMVGANVKITLRKKQILYSQILLDEFLLAELRADFNQWRSPDKDIQSGWWANKYAIQLGWRSLQIFGLKGLESRVEYNVSRPFTYAHSSPIQSYSNFNMSLAHPLGANFEEYILYLQYSNDQWLFKAYLNHHKQGVSLDGTNYGDNVLLSNSSRVQEYENDLLQGRLNTVNFIDLSISRLVSRKTNTSLQLGLQSRSEDFDSELNNESFIYLKITSNLHNTYFDF